MPVCSSDKTYNLNLCGPLIIVIVVLCECIFSYLTKFKVQQNITLLSLNSA